jgi:CheY-like chemotaxis protein
VFEVLPITAAMRKALTRAPSEGALAAVARASGVSTLRRAAIVKAMRGETTFEEVARVTHQDATEGLVCPACARRLADDMIVCPWCDTAVGRGHCGGCTRQLEPEWRVCPWCRTPAPDGPRHVAGTPPKAHERPRVLVVDDDESVCAYVATVLGEAATVDTASTATQALDLVGSRDYDVAVIDHGLPDLSGVELIRLLRTEPGTALLPLLLFTGQDVDTVEASARLAGADDFLMKPADANVIEERVLALAARSPHIAAQ